MSNEARKLVKAINEADIRNPYVIKMASILLAIRGLETALEFVNGVSMRGDSNG